MAGWSRPQSVQSRYSATASSKARSTVFLGQRRSSTDLRELMVSDRWVASSMVKLLDQDEQRCEERGTYPT